MTVLKILFVIAALIVVIAGVVALAVVLELLTLTLIQDKDVSINIDVTDGEEDGEERL